jgi:hypothetical protein
MDRGYGVPVLDGEIGTMDGSTDDELCKRYRDMPDGELLNLAADSNSLTAVAATALKQELERRQLSQADLTPGSITTQEPKNTRSPIEGGPYRS